MTKLLRSRLTLWYGAALAVAMALFSAGLFMLLDRSLRQRMDGSLGSAGQVTALALNHEIEEHLGKEEGEESMRLVLNTMHQTSFPRPNIAVWDGSRLVAEKSGLAGLAAIKVRDAISSAAKGDHVTLTVQENQQRYRIFAAKVWVPLSQISYLVIANESLQAIEEEMRSVLRILLIIAPAFLALSITGGYILARQSLAPVMDMARRAELISSDNLDQRLPVGNPNDELGLLAETFNRLIARLQNAFQQQRQFMADASHELRTPVSVALTATQVSLDSKTNDVAPLYDTLEVVECQMRRLRRSVEDMFTLAQADSGGYKAAHDECDLSEIVHESLRAGRVLGSGQGVEINAGQIVSEAAYVGDESLLRQLVLILLDNAVKFTPSGGKVVVSLAAADQGYRLTVSDSGWGIPPDDRARIFDRFYRGRTRPRSEPATGSGAGLGLAIASWIAGLHGGRVWLERSGPDGSEFCVELPFAAVPESSGDEFPGRADVRSTAPTW